MSSGSIKMVATKPLRYAGVAYGRGQEFQTKQAMHARLLVAAKRARYAITSIATAPVPVVVTPAPQPEGVQLLGDQTATVLSEYFAALAPEAAEPHQEAPSASPNVEPAADPIPEPAAPPEVEQPATSKRRYRRRDMTAQDSEG